MHKYFRLWKKQKTRQVAISMISIIMLAVINLQPVFGGVGPGTDTLMTDDIVVRNTYVSDYSTSKIEDLFKDQNKDDGRIETDKSVMYGEDEYSVFNKYESGEFSVTLSALGQKYKDTKRSTIHVPLDVVLILDISGSMSVKGDGKRADNMVSAVNNTITYLMREDKNNRVAVVAYNNNATKILPLGRYYVGENEDYSKTNTYFSVGSSTVYNGYKNLKIEAIKSEGTKKNVEQASKILEVYGATYMQDGIREAANILINEKNTTYKDEKSGEIVVRTPNLLLLSDGVPTLGNSDYKNLDGTKKFGDGTACDSGNITDKTQGYSQNDKGIFGYYTILTAQYYKDKIGIHYNGTATDKNNIFYTIGVGVSEGSGYDYISQVLHPSATNLAACKNSSDPRAKELYEALTKAYENNATINVGSSNTGVQANNSTTYITNPYDKYNYANNCKMGKDNVLTSESLAEIFKQLLQESMDVVSLHSCVEEGLSNAVEIVDNIGKGMEIKDFPVLIYNGNNYNVAQISKVGNETTYRYEGNVTSATYGNADVNLRDLKVIITEDTNGCQTLKLIITSELLPENVQLQTGNQYKKALPLRLCYKVAPNKGTISEVAKFKTMEEEKVLYTNMWQEEKVAYSSYVPSQKNPFYYESDESISNAGYENRKKNKQINVTNTKSYSISYEEIKNGKVTAKLGNNGKLVLGMANLNKIYDLPDTGGSGTFMYRCVGTVMSVLAILLYKKHISSIKEGKA